MPRRVAGRGDQPDRAVAEQVDIAFDFAHGAVGSKGQGGPGEGPVVFGLLDQHGGGGEHIDIADMVAMGVGDRDEADIGRANADFGQLVGQLLRPPPGHGAARRGQAVGHGGDPLGDARIPHHPALGMADQIAFIDQADGLADIHAGRPARPVERVALAAIEHIEALDPGGAAFGRHGEPQGDHGENERQPAHDVLQGSGSRARIPGLGFPSLTKP